ncbi:hypothetical protein Acsp04_55640 [Actinomadura sp. NBRC 104425]|nr:hypothetical protein Acsp04_55640 [Actinomadura sp. NBRC 104425]
MGRLLLPRYMSSNRSRIRVERSAKRVRAYLGGQVVADTVRPTLVWEGPHYPTYYIPLEDVRAELVPDGSGRHSPSRGDATAFTVKADGAQAPGAALRYEQSPIEELRDLVRLDWNAMDAWFEEDEQVFVHPRDPYHRVDVLASSRHVRIEVDGVTVAESSSPRLLFETGLPVRYYLPKTHVRMDLLEPSDTVTGCPYKGEAEYWSVRVGDRVHMDLAWSYRHPLPESQKIAGLVCFYDEKVDVFVDGVRQERPKTRF